MFKFSYFGLACLKAALQHAAFEIGSMADNMRHWEHLRRRPAVGHGRFEAAHSVKVLALGAGANLAR